MAIDTLNLRGVGKMPIEMLADEEWGYEMEFPVGLVLSTVSVKIFNLQTNNLIQTGTGIIDGNKVNIVGTGLPVGRFLYRITVTDADGKEYKFRDRIEVNNG